VSCGARTATDAASGEHRNARVDPVLPIHCICPDCSPHVTGSVARGFVAFHSGSDCARRSTDPLTMRGRFAAANYLRMSRQPNPATAKTAKMISRRTMKPMLFTCPCLCFL
jgi:hypothetical protein